DPVLRHDLTDQHSDSFLQHERLGASSPRRRKDEHMMPCREVRATVSCRMGERWKVRGGAIRIDDQRTEDGFGFCARQEAAWRRVGRHLHGDLIRILHWEREVSDSISYLGCQQLHRLLWNVGS